MPALLHILLAYVAIGLQRGLDPWLTIGSARADLVLIATIFMVTALPPQVGPLVGMAVGLVYDLTGAGPLGTHAFALGLAGFVALRLQTVGFSGWLRLWGVTGGCAFVYGMTLFGLGLVRGWLAGDGWGPTFLGGMGTGLLTTLLAVPLAWLLWRVRPVMAIAARR